MKPVINLVRPAEMAGQAMQDDPIMFQGQMDYIGQSMQYSITKHNHSSEAS